jgi:hypothetical protein
MTSTKVKQFISKKFCPLAPLQLLSQPSALTSNTRRASRPFLRCRVERNERQYPCQQITLQYTDFTSHIDITHTKLAHSYTSFIHSQILALFCKTHFVSLQHHHASKTAIFHRDAQLSKLIGKIRWLVRQFSVQLCEQ